MAHRKRKNEVIVIFVTYGSFMAGRNGEKINVLYFLNRLLQRLLPPSILHTVFILQYPYTEHPKIINI